MNKLKKTRIVFADDHAVVRDGLRSLFEGAPAFSVVGEAGDGQDAVTLATKLRPDVVILDISMPVLNGIEATRLIKKNVPGAKVLILTIHESEEFVNEMIQAGANGYVLKNAEKQEILTAVTSVAAGVPFFSPTVSMLILEQLSRKSKELQNPRFNDHPILSRREVEVLRCVAEGLTSREIATRLNISFSTVNSHRTNLMRKLEIHETAGLVRYAIQHEIVSVGS